MHSEEYVKRLNGFLDMTISNAQTVVAANTHLGSGDAMIALTSRLIDGMMTGCPEEAETVILCRIHMNHCHQQEQSAVTSTEASKAKQRSQLAMEAYNQAVQQFAEAAGKLIKASMN